MAFGTLGTRQFFIMVGKTLEQSLSILLWILKIELKLIALDSPLANFALCGATWHSVISTRTII